MKYNHFQFHLWIHHLIDSFHSVKTANLFTANQHVFFLLQLPCALSLCVSRKSIPTQLSENLTGATFHLFSRKNNNILWDGIFLSFRPSAKMGMFHFSGILNWLNWLTGLTDRNTHTHTHSHIHTKSAWNSSQEEQEEVDSAEVFWLYTRLRRTCYRACSKKWRRKKKS